MTEDRNLKQDLLALGLLAAVVFMGVALATYQNSDPPSTLVYPAGDEVSNACGRSGAVLAQWALEGLGIGAYYLIFSLAILDVMLLARRPIDQRVIRAGGWFLSLLGMTTLIALVGPQASPGPVIGAGGYLGTAGRQLLELHFATAGALIVTLSMIAAGLLLCTDYLLVRLAAGSLQVTFRGLTRLGQAVAPDGEAGDAEDDAGEAEDDEEEEEEEEDEYEYEEEDECEEDESDEEEADEPSKRKSRRKAKRGGRRGVSVRFRGVSSTSGRDGDAAEAGTESDCEKTKGTAAGGAKGRLSLALRASKPKQNEHDDVIETLDAASRSDEQSDYELPSLELLLQAEEIPMEAHEREVRRKAKILEKTFESFGFHVRVVEIETGPVIAQYEVELESGLRLSKITGLADDLAIALRVPSVRIVAPIPGKNTVGIEVPNDSRQLVRLREVIEESKDRTRRMKIPIFLGKDVSGNPMLVDLATLPHLLIAGRTGTGKSVCLNSIIASMLMTRRPDEVRMLMIDPKMVELSPYKQLPHLMHPVVTDMRKAEAILAWAVDKMEERYGFLARAGVRHVTAYNQLGEDELRDRMHPETDEEWDSIPKHMPFLVIIADEIADLMMTCGKEVEQHIIRLAQKSRAVGIHLILATQKPTVDVITGLIKSNLPARVAFQVASRTDSRVVLDEMGADKLLGNGDMLFLLPGTSTLIRGQGTYLSDDEINRLIGAVATAEPQFVTELVQLKVKEGQDEGGGKLSNRDDLYENAVDVVVREGRGSVSLLQRTLGIGYGRAARLIDYMAEDGIVGSYNGSQAREVLLTLEQWQAMSGEQGEQPTASPPPRSNRILPDPPTTPASDLQQQQMPTLPLSQGDNEPYDEDAYDEDEGEKADAEAEDAAVCDDESDLNEVAAVAGNVTCDDGQEEDDEDDDEYEYEYEEEDEDEGESEEDEEGDGDVDEEEEEADEDEEDEDEDEEADGDEDAWDEEDEDEDENEDEDEDEEDEYEEEESDYEEVEADTKPAKRRRQRHGAAGGYRAESA
jgi:S-DNA-T family DNA segregation ATPase FtsK/SpoIIIE